MLFSNMRGTRIPWLFGFKNYLISWCAYSWASMLFPNIREPRMPRLHGLKHYVNNCFAYRCTLNNSLICVDIVSPGY